MPLVKQLVPLTFARGLDTKTDEKIQEAGKVTVAENYIYTTPEALVKRNGYTAVSLKDVDGGEVGTPKMLTKFKDELNMFDTDELYSFSESLDAWKKKGTVYAVQPESTPVVRSESEQDQVDALSIDGLHIYAFRDSLTGVKYSVVDSNTGNFIVSDELISSTGERPRVANIENFIYVFFIDGTDLKYRRFNLLDADDLETEVVTVSDVDPTNPNYDAQNSSNVIGVAYNSSDVGSRVKLFSIDDSQVLSSIISLAGEDASNAINLYVDPSYRFVLSWASPTEVKYAIFPLNLISAIITPTLIETISEVRNLTSVRTTDSDYTIFYEVGATNPSDHLIRKNTFTLAGVVGTPSEVAKSVGLASKTYINNDSVFINTVHESLLQSTYFVMDENGIIVTRISGNLAGSLLTHGSLPNVTDLGDSKFLFTSQIKGKLVSDSGSFFSLLGVNSTIIDFEPENPFQTSELGDNLHIAGGLIQMYDGEKVVEHGFHLFPEGVEENTSNTVGGSLDDGTRQYVAVYSWTDNFGQQHRSAPSIPITVELTGGTSTQESLIDIPTLRLTEKDNVVLELYRTENLGTIFYKVTSINNPTFNDPTLDVQTITDGLSDADLISNEILYNTGGVLDNIVAPSASLITSYQNRIILAGLEDKNLIQYSKIRTQGRPVEFEDTFVIEFPNTGGDISSMIVMDEKLIVFKNDAIFYIAGEGPNNLGEQNTFIEPEQISSDVGCIDSNSVVLTPAGVFFKSRKGIYLLSRNLQTTYIGDDVEEFNDLTITSAKVINDLNQVRFITSDGNCLVFNYYAGFWSTFTNHKGLSSEVIGEDYYYIRPSGLIYKEDQDSFSDNGSVIKSRIESNWLQFNNIQGFQRVYKMLVVGNYKSPHSAKVRIAYDFVEAFVQEATIDAANFIDETTYGEDSPYGDPSTKAYGGSGKPYQFRVNPTRQKCQAIKIIIEDLQEVAGAAFNLTAVTFEVGAKEGGMKLPLAQKYSTDG